MMSLTRVLAALILVLAAACAAPADDSRATAVPATAAAPVTDGAAAPTRAEDTTDAVSDDGVRPADVYTPVAEGVGPGPPCPANASCTAAFAFNGALYQLSCGALDAAEVEPTPLAVGQVEGRQLAVHAIRGADPAVVVAVRPLYCDGPLDTGPDGFHTAFQQELALPGGRPSQAFNDAMCRAALFGVDPAEGFTCPSPSATAS